MENPRILVLVLSADVSPYDALAQAVRETWGGFRTDQWRTIFYWGRKKGDKTLVKKSTLQGDDLLVGVEDSVHTILHRTLRAHRFAIDNMDFDYVFNCCSGSYIVPSLLLELARKKPRERVYCGITAPIPKDRAHLYVSGSGMLLSRDVVRALADNATEIAKIPWPGYEGDIVIGTFLNKIGIAPDLDAKRSDNNTTPVQGCYHYHVGASVPMMHAVHRNLSAKPK